MPTIAFLCHFLVNRELLCSGRDEGIVACPDSVQDGSGEFLACKGCLIPSFDEAMRGPGGRIISRALVKSDAIDLGVTVTLHEIPALEFTAMRALQIERNKRDDKKQDK